jgi:hypothetical protein
MSESLNEALIALKKELMDVPWIRCRSLAIFDSGFENLVIHCRRNCLLSINIHIVYSTNHCMIGFAIVLTEFK